MKQRSKIQPNFNILMSLTKKLNHLDRIKWYRRYKNLLYLKIRKSFQKCLQYFFADSRKKKFRVGTFQQRRSGNCKHTHFFWPDGVSNIISGNEEELLKLSNQKWHGKNCSSISSLLVFCPVEKTLCDILSQRAICLA